MKCGASVARACGKCGTELPVEAAFCFSCGQPVGAATSGESRFTTPDSYTPRHLAERILTSKAALEGERKQVTVLFADLKGSRIFLASSASRSATPSTPRSSGCWRQSHRYEGSVNRPAMSFD
jgi:hypothetical protein